MPALTAAVLVLLLGAGACLLPLSNPVRAAIGILSQLVATVLVWLVVAPVLLGGEVLAGALAWAYPVGTLRVRLDALGAFFLAWSLPMTLLGAIYARGYLQPYFSTRRHIGVHYALLNMVSLSFVLVYAGDHALLFLLGWEIAALSAWLLVIWDYTNQRVRFAGFNYLVSTHVGLMFLVAAVMILYTHAAAWDLVSFGAWLQQHPGAERNAVFLLLLISFGLKSAFFPFHSWLPRAHAAAPAHVSALMSGVIHKAGLYALVRFLWLMGRPDEWMGWCLIAFSACSALVGALYTVGQRDLKRMLGYSSTENVGIAGIGIGIGCLGLSWNNPVLITLGFTGGLLHVLNHAFFKCQLFYAAGAMYHATHTVDLERLGGLARWMPWTAGAFLVGGMAISALPPFNGFASEFTLYSALFSVQDMPLGARVALCGVGALLAFVGAISALSITRAFGVAFLGTPRDPELPAVREVNRWMLLPMGLHAAGVLVLGLFPALGLQMLQGTVDLAQSLPGTGVSAGAQAAAADLTQALSRIGIVGALLLGLLLLALAVRRWRARTLPQAQSVTWGCGYAAVSPRMQYSGASFSADFAARFDGILGLGRRQKPVEGYFPGDAWLTTDCTDAVERRLFDVIRQGDGSASALSQDLREDDPRIAFAAGLVALVAIAGLVLMAGGPLQ